MAVDGSIFMTDNLGLRLDISIQIVDLNPCLQ